MEQMTSRERMVTAMRNGKPDRVPVSPDMSNMIPARMTGRPFWDMYLYSTPTFEEAQVKATHYFGFDSCFGVYSIIHNQPDVTLTKETMLEETPVYKKVLRVWRTPKDDLSEITVYPVADPPTLVKKMFETKEQLERNIDYFCNPDVRPDREKWNHVRKLMGEDQALGGVVFTVPGLHNWVNMIEGGLNETVMWVYDTPAIFERVTASQHRFAVKCMEALLALNPDFVSISNSGTLTLSSPELVEKYPLPTVKELTRIARQAGVPTELHSCGKSRFLVELYSSQTDLNCINPLEEPPMGDCVLAEIKQTFGARIALKGNLHTTTVMLKGSVADVERAAKQAIDDAGAGGGFILSTGDQCGRDTPDANIFKMIEVAKTYGRY